MKMSLMAVRLKIDTSLKTGGYYFSYYSGESLRYFLSDNFPLNLYHTQQ